jgi:CP family cyanate transporter-like MFS transporter
VRRASVPLLAALFVAALASRPQLVAVGPLLPEIQHDLDVPHAVVGLLVSLPILCMGLFAPPGALLSDRLGPRAAMTICLAGIACFGLARAVSPGAAAVLGLTFLMSMGLGASQAVVPVAVKEDFPDRPGFPMGVYALGVNLGVALGIAIAVPLADWGGSWRWTLGVISVAGGVLVVAWLLLTRQSPAHRRSGVSPPRLPWRNGLAWRLAGIFGGSSVTFYGVTAWLPDAYVEQGWSEARAGALVAVATGTTVLTVLLVPWMADRWGTRRMYLVGIAAGQLVALLGFVLVPQAAWLWAVVIGLAFGGQFPIVMMLPLDAAERPAEVGALAGMMLLGGYGIGAFAPLLLGAARDVTGSFTLTLWLMVAAAGMLVVLGASMSRDRLRAGAHGRPARAYD